MKQKMDQEEAERVYLSRVRASISNIAEVTLSDALKVDFDTANDGLTTLSFHFMEKLLTKIIQNGALGKAFDRNIER